MAKHCPPRGYVLRDGHLVLARSAEGSRLGAAGVFYRDTSRLAAPRVIYPREDSVRRLMYRRSLGVRFWRDDGAVKFNIHKGHWLAA
jgi:hypothetical protein